MDDPSDEYQQAVMAEPHIQTNKINPEITTPAATLVTRVPLPQT